jgi:hypothetical protein
VPQMRKNLSHHCRQWRDQQNALWKIVRKATGRKAGRCRQVPESELFTIEACNHAIVQIPASTDGGNIPCKSTGGTELPQGSFLELVLGAVRKSKSDIVLSTLAVSPYSE